MEKPPDTTLVKLEIDDASCHIILSREEKYNAMNSQMIEELIGLLNWSADNSVATQGRLHDEDGVPLLRVVIISGAGKHFCAGADINMMRDAGAKTAEQNREDSKRLDALFNGLWSHPCFTIGAIQGVALGGGAGLIACMDHVVAARNTRIALSEGKLGILPAVIGPYVYRRVGSACFRRLAMQASRIDADEALRIGMVEQLVDTVDDLAAKVDEMVAELMTTGPMAVAKAKELTLNFDRWASNDDELRQWTLDYTSRMRASDEGQEGLSSFLENKDANWKSGSK
ncbi:MAG: enoyl-CoA hydratase-related protein [Candidatus Poseidoniaceae archaeon]|jgi:methylglutaconyl-CoA hydratase|nr:enoyl-CoA hydratase-related protein [Candidatus Poseidoniaceae archaeon]